MMKSFGEFVANKDIKFTEDLSVNQPLIQQTPPQTSSAFKITSSQIEEFIATVEDYKNKVDMIATKIMPFLNRASQENINKILYPRSMKLKELIGAFKNKIGVARQTPTWQRPGGSLLQKPTQKPPTSPLTPDEISRTMRGDLETGAATRMAQRPGTTYKSQ